MIILDTNVLSELMRLNANPSVLGWIASTNPDELRITTITQAEILSGIALLAEGRRRTNIALEAERTFADFRNERIWPFDSLAAEDYALLVADRRRMGRPIQPFDAQIAAIARSRSAMLATRNTRDFEGCGISVIDPWEA